MKGKLILLVYVMMAAMTHAAIGQNKKALPKIQISGVIPESMQNDIRGIIEVFCQEQITDRVMLGGDRTQARFSGNRFSVEIQPESEIFYLKLRGGPEHIQLLESLWADALLVNPGDSITVHFSKSKAITFSGRGTEKLNFQIAARKMIWDTGGLKVIKKLNVPLIKYWKVLTSRHLQENASALELLKAYITPQTYKVLAVNSSSAIASNYAGCLTSGLAEYLNDSLYLNAIKSELQTVDIMQRSFVEIDPFTIDKSSNYISDLSSFQQGYVRVMSGEDSPSFAAIYQKILRDYRGKLRDEILVRRINDSYANGGADYLDSALKIVIDEKSKSRLLQMHQNKSAGVEMPDYAFEDVNGKKRRLSEFRGKVVVLEAYFLGCLGCVGLADRMRPIVEHYKNNKNIVFISLSVDRKKETFLKSVNSGEYGSTGNTYLYTNGEATMHPLCLTFRWNSFPQTIYLDKKGKLISGAGIDPSNEDKKKQLIRLLDQHL